MDIIAAIQKITKDILYTFDNKEIIITLLHEITKLQPYTHQLNGAPCVIIVCGDIELKAYEQYKNFGYGFT